MKNIQLTANHVGSRYECDQMLDFIVNYNVKPQIEVYQIADCQIAFDSLIHGKPKFPKFRNVLETASFMQSFTPRDY